MTTARLRYCPLFKPGVSFPPHAFLNAAAQERMEALDGKTDRGDLLQEVLDGDGFQAAADLSYALEGCRKSNALDYAVYDGSVRIACVRPRSDAFEFRSDAAPGPLSRFAFVRREGDRMVLESPLSDATIELESLELRHPSIAILLASTGFAETAEENDAPAAFWEFHDLMFHHRSRLSPDLRIGATWRFGDHLESPAAAKPAMSTVSTRLEIPPLAGAFQEVLETRRSLRTPGPQPISIASLGEFLYRSVAIREQAGDQLRRPYPSGGAIHELEYYIAVRACDGLPRGFYHYRAGEHALCRLNAESARVDQLIEQAVTSWGRQYPSPDLLITLAARLPRIAWKYEGMAYRTILINAGCAIQTMYLVATAMHLAPCAIGNGDPRLFHALTGINPREETSVAEFALSSRGER